VLRNSAYVFLNGQCVFHYIKQGNFHEEVGEPEGVYVPGAKSGVVQIEGIWFGFEICLDHMFGYLSRQIRKNRELMVHIVVSATVDKVREHRDFLPIGGYYIHASTAPVHAKLADLEGSVVGRRAGVFKKVGPGRFRQAKRLYKQKVAGSELIHY